MKAERPGCLFRRFPTISKRVDEAKRTHQGDSLTRGRVFRYTPMPQATSLLASFHPEREQGPPGHQSKDRKKGEWSFGCRGNLAANRLTDKREVMEHEDSGMHRRFGDRRKGHRIRCGLRKELSCRSDRDVRDRPRNEHEEAGLRQVRRSNPQGKGSPQRGHEDHCPSECRRQK